MNDTASRPSWTRVLASMLEPLRQRATCPRLAAAAIAYTNDYHVLSTGYNGAPRAHAHCSDVGCLLVDGHCLRTIHAEMNVVLQAARFGISLEGALLIATHRPCLRCTPALLQVGLRQVTYLTPYGSDDDRDRIHAMFAASNVGLRQLKLETP